MPKPQKYKDVTKFLKSQGWLLIRQGKGSHEIWGNGSGSILAVPRHGEVSAGVVKQIIDVFPESAPQNWRF